MKIRIAKTDSSLKRPYYPLIDGKPLATDVGNTRRFSSYRAAMRAAERFVQDEKDNAALKAKYAGQPDNRPTTLGAAIGQYFTP